MLLSLLYSLMLKNLLVFVLECLLTLILYCDSVPSFYGMILCSSVLVDWSFHPIRCFFGFSDIDAIFHCLDVFIFYIYVCMILLFPFLFLGTERKWWVAAYTERRKLINVRLGAQLLQERLHSSGAVHDWVLRRGLAVENARPQLRFVYFTRLG